MIKIKGWGSRVGALVVSVGVLAACGQAGPPGPAGSEGTPGPAGSAGAPGTSGANGANGEGGANGANGEGGANGDGGGGGGGTVGETAGTRVHPRYTTTTTVGLDGTKQVTKYFAGWFDTSRNETCSVTLAVDGKTRCVPAAAPIFASCWSDAACTKPVATVYSAGSSCPPPAPKYVSGPPILNGCGSATRIFSAGAKLALTNWYLGPGGGGACTSSAVPVYYDVYDASGAEIPVASFQEFTVTTVTQ